MDELIKAVADRMPQFNKYLLVDYDKQQINASINFVDTCFKLATKIIGCGLHYKGCIVVSPEERVSFELYKKRGRKKDPYVTMVMSELKLVKFIFEHDGETYDTYLYIPYMVQNMLHIEGKRFSLIKGIVEKVFSKIDGKDGDGIMIRPIRARLAFCRICVFKLVTTDNVSISHETIVSAKLHLLSHGRRKCDTTILHYILCKLGFRETMNKFSISEDELSFVDKIDKDENYKYFTVLEDNVKSIYLKTKVSLLKESLYRKIIANLLYILTNFDIYEISDLYEESGSIYRIMLGLIINPNESIAKSRADMDTHIYNSVDYFIDPLMKKRLQLFNIPVDNIYELLVYIFINIDYLVVNCSTQNLFEKRIDISDGVLIKAYAEKIFRNVYGNKQHSNLKPTEIRKILRIPCMTIENAYKPTTKKMNDNGLRNINNNPQIFGDNWLLSCGAYKTRHLGNNTKNFHTSIPVVESTTSFTGKDVGRTGFINPFLEITSEGVVVIPEYAKDIEDLSCE